MVRHDNGLHFSQFRPTKSVVCDKLNGVKPKFCLLFPCLNMNMRWFNPFIAVEKEPKAPESQDYWHARARFIMLASDCSIA